MLDENRKLSLRELAYLWGLTISETEYEVCDCDWAAGYICDYHRNPSEKHTLSEWQKMTAIRIDPVNDIDNYPKTKRLKKDQ